MNSIATGITAALISGVVMYTAGAKTAQANAFGQNTASAQIVDGQLVPASYATTLRPAAVSPATTVTPINSSRRPSAPRRMASRSTAPAPVREVVVEEDVKPERSWGKTAMIVGGSAASGAGVGGILGGKKGALIGAAIGGGAASIYEGTRRR